MAIYQIYRETATTEGLVTEGTTFRGTPEGLRNHANRLMAEGNTPTQLRIAVVAFCKLKTKVIVLTRRNNVVCFPPKDVLASLPTEEEYAQRATRLENVLVRPSIDELLDS